jgi:uncharacterized protein YraI
MTRMKREAGSKIMTVVQGARRNAVIRFVWLLLATLAILPPAQAAPERPNGYPVTNVNLRAGPGTDYPVIVVVPARSWISIRGCLGDHSWCEVAFEGSRGWMRSIYLQGWYRGHYYALRDYAPRLGYPVVTFDLGPYWDNNYRDRPFYAQRARWDAPRGEGWTNRSTFYGRLEPYGSWIWLQGQYVWVPRNVGPYWRPYTLGRWVFTDRYGWMWVSDEPFGWATYHYGRWGFSNRVGWFWVPGSRWAPAWVSWRSSNDYLAWAPLPPTPDEGLSINITVGNVPDYYWQVVPNRDFLAPDLPRRIVRDRDRYRPILHDTRPLGNVTVVNNTVVNNVVNVTYVEEKTNKKVVVHKVERTKDESKAKGGKEKGEVVEVFQPAPEAKAAVVAPAETKPIEEVAAESKTKQQGEGAAATEELLVPAEVKKPLEAEAKPPAPPPPAPAAEGGAPTPAAEEAAPPPPPPPPPAAGAAQPTLTPAPSEEAAPPPPPPAEGATPPAPPVDEAGPPPPPPADGAPPPAPAPTGETAPPPPPPAEATPPAPPPPAKEETPPPPPPAEEAAPPPPPPAKEEPPPPVEKSAPSAPPPPPPAEDMPPPPPAEEMAPPPPPADEPAPKAKKEGKPKRDRDAQPDESGSPTFAPPPPPPAEEMAPPPPPADEPAPKARKEGKPKRDRDAQPDESGPPAFPPSPEGDMAPPSSSPMSGDDAPQVREDRKPKKKKDKDGPCPDGMVLLEDGNCVPSQ